MNSRSLTTPNRQRQANLRVVGVAEMPDIPRQKSSQQRSQRRVDPIKQTQGKTTKHVRTSSRNSNGSGSLFSAAESFLQTGSLTKHSTSGESTSIGSDNDEQYPDAKTLTDFFGTKVDGAQKKQKRLSRKASSGSLTRKNRSGPEESAATTADDEPRPTRFVMPSPIRQMHWKDPMMREMAIEELMMSRYNLKPEDALCLVADARTNVGSSKWQTWTEELYLECEKIYEESYKQPAAAGGVVKVIPVRPDGLPVTTDAAPKGEDEYVMANPYSYDDMSTWGSESGWSALWDDHSRHNKFGFSLQTHDEDDLYTVGVIQEMQKNSVIKAEKPERALETKQEEEKGVEVIHQQRSDVSLVLQQSALPVTAEKKPVTKRRFLSRFFRKKRPASF